MKKKFVLLMTTCVITLACLFGCGNENNSQDDNKTTSVDEKLEKSKELNDINIIDTVYQAVRVAYADETGNKALKDIASLNIGVLLTDITSKVDNNEFAKIVDEYLEGRNPNDELTSAAATVDGAAIYVKILEGKVIVWIGTGTTANDICKTAKTLDKDGNVAEFLIGEWVE